MSGGSWDTWKKGSVCSYPQSQGICAHELSCVQLFVTAQTVARQAPLSMGFPRPEKQDGDTDGGQKKSQWNILFNATNVTNQRIKLSKKKNRGGKRKGKINKLNPHVSKVRKYIDIIQRYGDYHHKFSEQKHLNKLCCESGTEE